MAKPAIGFIGLGLMGGAMVSRLQDCGYDLTVLGNRDRTHIDQALAKGATEANDAKAVAQNSDIVMLCMGTSDHVESRSPVVKVWNKGSDARFRVIAIGLEHKTGAYITFPFTHWGHV